jgi:outer membrane protein OmpA-like peptidoglycan-associated protein
LPEQATRFASRAAAIGFAVAFAAPAAVSGPREDALATFDALAQTSQAWLQIQINDGKSSDLRIGAPIAYRFESGRDAHLTVILIDAHGAAVVLYPNMSFAPNGIQAGETKLFPFELEAVPPIGIETLIAIATPRPITVAELGIGTPSGPFLVADPSGAPALAQRIASLVSKMPEDSVALARVEQRILTQGEGPQYLANTIVRYFDERPRAIHRPKLDLHIRFDFDSSDLTDLARRDLDEVGRALREPTLRGEHFELAGHTDDIGDDDYNRDLSLRRARSARQYLIDRFEIEPERLGATGYGESQPLIPGTSEDARKLNRRVGLELIR